MLDLIIKNGSCYIDKDLKDQDIAIKDGKITEIGKIDNEAKEVLDAKEFLQNLVSNDINKVNDNNSCFASLLTPQGKFLFAFIVV